MINKLNKQGVTISLKEIKNKIDDEYIGRPHIAQEMIEKGYIDEIGEAFTDKYIGNNGQAYVSKYKLTPKKAIKIVKEAEGISVVAHPGFINNGHPQNKEDIEEMKKSGLEGIEVFHSRHSSAESAYYQSVAKELDLVITGGSDFHGDKTPDIELGDVELGNNCVGKLKAVNENIN